MAGRGRTGAAGRARSRALTRDGYAQRAADAHRALLQRFDRGDGTLKPDGRLHARRTITHLWPFARALFAELDLLGIPGGDSDRMWALVEDRRDAMERYWDERGPAYASDPPGGRFGGDIYYDDNAWAGLALVQLERMRPGESRLDRAAQIADYARAGWATDPALAQPGGVYWTEQGHGAGARNHDRNAISTAPNAQIMAHLAELGGAGTSDSAGADDGEPQPTPERCAAWVTEALRGPGGLIRDKIRGDGSVDLATWSYNQGSMVGLHVLLARRAGADVAAHLSAARGLATRALDHYDAGGYSGERDEFVAIFVRNLLQLHAVIDDRALRDRIVATLRERADVTWARPGRDRAPLLEVSARVSLQALAAWDPADYGRLA